MATSTLKPQNLRSFLAVVLSIVIIGGGGLFYLSLQEIRTFSLEVNQSVARAESSGVQVKALQGLKSQLAQSEALIAKANQIFATPGAYQNQATTDIRNYAVASGVAIAKTSFSAEVPGANHTMTVSLKAPVSYEKLIHFLDGVEGNVPKMQVSSISLSHVKGGGADSVNVGDIKITISTR